MVIVPNSLDVSILYEKGQEYRDKCDNQCGEYFLICTEIDYELIIYVNSVKIADRLKTGWLDTIKKRMKK